MAATLYARGLVTWTLGDVIYRLRGGTCRLSGERSGLSLHSIIACDGVAYPHKRPAPPLTNRALFRRDQHLCLYCGKPFPEHALTRDHIVPTSKGGGIAGPMWSPPADAVTSARAAALWKTSIWICWHCRMCPTWPNTWH